MRRHGGMRPQDIVIVLKAVVLGNQPWRAMDIASELFISQSEVSEALDRNRIAGLMSTDKRHVNKASLFEFLTHGVRFVFPEQPGQIVRGVPTGHSAPPLASMIAQSSDIYVWPFEEGTVRGQKVEPLYPTVPRATRADKRLYELLALVDAIRLGKARERTLAVKELESRLKD